MRVQGSADGDDLLRVDATGRLLAEVLPHPGLQQWHARLTAHEDDLLEVAGAEPGVGEDRVGDLHRPRDEVSRQLLQLAAGQRALEMERRAPGGRRVEERKRDLRLLGEGQLQLGLLRRIAQPLQRHAVLAQVDAVLPGEGRHQPVDDPLVQILSAEEGVAAGGAHLVDAAVELQDRDVERSSAQIEDQDPALQTTPVPVGDGGRGGLVEDAQDLQSGDGPGVLGGLTLPVVEVRGDGDDGLGHRLVEEGLGVGLEGGEHQCGELGQRGVPPAQLHAHVVVGAGADRIGQAREALLDLGRGELAPDEPLGSVDRRLRIGDRLALGDRAHQPLVAARERHHRRRQVLSRAVGDDDRLPVLDRRDHAVGGTEIDADDGSAGVHGVAGRGSAGVLHRPMRSWRSCPRASGCLGSIRRTSSRCFRASLRDPVARRSCASRWWKLARSGHEIHRALGEEARLPWVRALLLQQGRGAERHRGVADVQRRCAPVAGERRGQIAAGLGGLADLLLRGGDLRGLTLPRLGQQGDQLRVPRLQRPGGGERLHRALVVAGVEQCASLRHATPQARRLGQIGVLREAGAALGVPLLRIPGPGHRRGQDVGVGRAASSGWEASQRARRPGSVSVAWASERWRKTCSSRCFSGLGPRWKKRSGWRRLLAAWKARFTAAPSAPRSSRSRRKRSPDAARCSSSPSSWSSAGSKPGSVFPMPVARSRRTQAAQPLAIDGGRWREGQLWVQRQRPPAAPGSTRPRRRTRASPPASGPGLACGWRSPVSMLSRGPARSGVGVPMGGPDTGCGVGSEKVGSSSSSSSAAKDAGAQSGISGRLVPTPSLRRARTGAAW